MRARNIFNNSIQWGGNTMPTLTWIAVLQLEDGKFHTYRQPSEDPADGFDYILEQDQKGNLISLFLEDAERQKAIGVNLKTGGFIFSFIYQYHPAPELRHQEVTYRLVNVRRMRKDMGTAGYSSGTYLAYYILGWQATVNDVNIQRLMFIDPDSLEITIKEKR